jgi:hypothetical protein
MKALRTLMHRSELPMRNKLVNVEVSILARTGFGVILRAQELRNSTSM